MQCQWQVAEIDVAGNGQTTRAIASAEGQTGRIGRKTRQLCGGDVQYRPGIGAAADFHSTADRCRLQCEIARATDGIGKVDLVTGEGQVMGIGIEGIGKAQGSCSRVQLQTVVGHLCHVIKGQSNPTEITGDGDFAAGVIGLRASNGDGGQCQRGVAVDGEARQGVLDSA